MLVDYVTAGPKRDELYVYLRQAEHGNPGRPMTLLMDGKSLTGTKIYGDDFPGGVALLAVKLATPLEAMSYHVVEVRADNGERIAAQFRVLPLIFMRTSYHIPPEECGKVAANFAMWPKHPLAVCEEHGVYATTYYNDMFDLHERVKLMMGPDEPDAKDRCITEPAKDEMDRARMYAVGLGFHARMLAESGWQKMIERFAPHVASWLVINGTTRPMNWFVYGQFADVSSFDPYPVTYYEADHAFVRESLALARYASMPKPLIAILEAYGWTTGGGVPSGARGPLPAEYRQNVVQAIGAGMKGLTSWVYSAGAGGWQNREEFAAEIKRMNKLLGHIEGDLLRGTPIDLASTDAGWVATGTVGDERWPKERVWAGSVLCGPKTMVVAVANHIAARKPEPPLIEPTENVTVTVKLPKFIPDVRAFEVTPDGFVKYDCSVAEGVARLKLESIESGRVFVLRRH